MEETHVLASTEMDEFFRGLNFLKILPPFFLFAQLALHLGLFIFSCSVGLKLGAYIAEAIEGVFDEDRLFLLHLLTAALYWMKVLNGVVIL